MNRKYFSFSISSLILGILACNLPKAISPVESIETVDHKQELPSSETPDITIYGQQQNVDTNDELISPESSSSSDGIVRAELHSIQISPADRIQPEQLKYIGAFRLPSDSGSSNWEYSGHALTYYPDGDPEGLDNGFPGSLFGAGHDQQLNISEISIPVPVKSKVLDDLNTAVTLQEFADLSNGMFNPEEMAIPRIGIEFLPPQAEQTSPKLHFVWGQHIQDFEYTHGWAEVDLSNPSPVGPWKFDGYTNYVTADYIFEIPKEWSDLYAPGMRLATGRAREGLWSGSGPGLFAYAPWADGNPPSPGTTLTTLTPLLLYGIQQPGIPEIASDGTMSMNGYSDSDHWMGGAWLTSGESSAVIFAGTKAIGKAWYGFANGVVWAMDCSETDSCPDVPEWPYDNRGFWADDYEAQVIFYDTSELAAVATGQMETWEPQPYATLSIQDVLIDPELDPKIYKRDFIGATAFDRENGLIYIIERLADEYKSIVHVWQIISE